MPRRKPGQILPLEAAILAAAVTMAGESATEFHGFELAKRLREGEGSAALTAHGTLYKALGRMEKAGLLASTWEDPDIAADAGRPRRRLYSITSEGRVALAEVEAAVDPSTPGLDPGWSPS